MGGKSPNCLRINLAWLLEMRFIVKIRVSSSIDQLRFFSNQASDRASFLERDVLFNVSYSSTTKEKLK
jgi:hypothetical protein